MDNENEFLIDFSGLCLFVVRAASGLVDVVFPKAEDFPGLNLPPHNPTVVANLDLLDRDQTSPADYVITDITGKHWPVWDLTEHEITFPSSTTPNLVLPTGDQVDCLPDPDLDSNWGPSWQIANVSALNGSHFFKDVSTTCRTQLTNGTLQARKPFMSDMRRAMWTFPDQSSTGSRIRPQIFTDTVRYRLTTNTPEVTVLLASATKQRQIVLLAGAETSAVAHLRISSLPTTLKMTASDATTRLDHFAVFYAMTNLKGGPIPEFKKFCGQVGVVEPTYCPPGMLDAKP
jgi:hypothetical protein